MSSKWMVCLEWLEEAWRVEFDSPLFLSFCKFSFSFSRLQSLFFCFGFIQYISQSALGLQVCIKSLQLWRFDHWLTLASNLSKTRKIQFFFCPNKPSTIWFSSQLYKSPKHAQNLKSWLVLIFSWFNFDLIWFNWNKNQNKWQK